MNQPDYSGFMAEAKRSQRTHLAVFGGLVLLAFGLGMVAAWCRRQWIVWTGLLFYAPVLAMDERRHRSITCPRCGNGFFRSGILGTRTAIYARRCANCGLKLE